MAVGEPLSLSLFEALAPPEGLDEVDRAGLLELVGDLRRAAVRLAHPLYGELLRVTTPPLRTRALHRQLADALAATGARRRDDLSALPCGRPRAA
jgi:hypothetical protein